jgi:3-phenylpropionate/trans-cinnamate dioxygenase ferredoxin reductase subunit
MKEGDMAEKKYQYVIVGGGLAGTSAIEGIREKDKSGAILLIGREKDMPYDRPPLSKKLWSGKKKIEDIFLHDTAFYKESNVELALGSNATGLDRGKKKITTGGGGEIQYAKLLLATGGFPRRLEIPGGDLEDVCYYRTLEDYRRIRGMAVEGKEAVIIGGGFIGSEIAAALSMNKLRVTMIFPEEYLVQRIFPEGLGRSIQNIYSERGITVLSGDVPSSFEKKSGRITTRTKQGKEVQSDIVIAGIGIVPSLDLARQGGIRTDNGIVVDEHLATSDPDVYAAGDNASFVSTALGQRMRVEHWDNSIAQGRTAGRNMAGAGEKFDYIPYFFSDLFEFGYEAAGMIDSRLETFSDWKKENDTGVIYYLKDGAVRGVMLCNVWEKIDAARGLIRSQKRMKPEELKGAIPA